MSNQHSDLPPVSYEALAENNRHTHANLDACIEARTRLVEQYEDLLRQRIELQNSIGSNVVTIDKLCEERGEAWQKIARLEEQLEAAEQKLTDIRAIDRGWPATMTDADKLREVKRIAGRASTPASGYDGLVEAPKAASDVCHNREQNAECIGTPGCYYGAGMSSHSPACGASTPASSLLPTHDAGVAQSPSTEEAR